MRVRRSPGGEKKAKPNRCLPPPAAVLYMKIPQKFMGMFRKPAVGTTVGISWMLRNGIMMVRGQEAQQHRAPVLPRTVDIDIVP